MEKEYYCIDCDKEFDWVDIVDGTKTFAICPECGELLANTPKQQSVYAEAFDYPEPAFRADDFEEDSYDDGERGGGWGLLR